MLKSTKICIIFFVDLWSDYFLVWRRGLSWNSTEWWHFLYLHLSLSLSLSTFSLSLFNENKLCLSLCVCVCVCICVDERKWMIAINEMMIWWHIVEVSIPSSDWLGNKKAFLSDLIEWFSWMYTNDEVLCLAEYNLKI